VQWKSPRWLVAAAALVFVSGWIGAVALHYCANIQDATAGFRYSLAGNVLFWSATTLAGYLASGAFPNTGRRQTIRVVMVVAIATMGALWTWIDMWCFGLARW
jgi:hypothetical protein